MTVASEVNKVSKSNKWILPVAVLGGIGIIAFAVYEIFKGGSSTGGATTTTQSGQPTITSPITLTPSTNVTPTVTQTPSSSQGLSGTTDLSGNYGVINFDYNPISDIVSNSYVTTTTTNTVNTLNYAPVNNITQNNQTGWSLTGGILGGGATAILGGGSANSSLFGIGQGNPSGSGGSTAPPITIIEDPNIGGSSSIFGMSFMTQTPVSTATTSNTQTSLQSLKSTAAVMNKFTLPINEPNLLKVAPSITGGGL
jgi:hypothetical protein